MAFGGTLRTRKRTHQSTRAFATELVRPDATTPPPVAVLVPLQGLHESRQSQLPQLRLGDG